MNRRLIGTGAQPESFQPGYATATREKITDTKEFKRLLLELCQTAALLQNEAKRQRRNLFDLQPVKNRAL
jgi:hypothetical protein